MSSLGILAKQLAKNKPKKSPPVSPNLRVDTLGPSYSIVGLLECIGVYTVKNYYYLTVDDVSLLNQGVVSDAINEWLIRDIEFTKLVQEYIKSS